jgi:hypothetical protein
MRSRTYPGAIDNFGRAPGGRAASSSSQIVDRLHFQQRVEWSAPEATAVSRIVIGANSGPRAKARHQSCGIRSALLWGQISVKRSSPPFACHQRVDRRGRVVMPDTETGPMLPRGLLAPPRQARHDPQSCSVIRQVAPMRALMHGRKPCCDRRCQVLQRRCWR